MGLNPFRDQKKTATDMVMMVIAIGAAIGAMLWAILSI